MADDEVEIIPSEDGYEVTKGQQGDAFDVGSPEVSSAEVGEYRQPEQGGDLISRISQDPRGFMESLKLQPHETEKVRSFGVVGGLSGLVHNLLSGSIGDTAAGALGGLAAGYLASRTRGGKKPRRR